MHKTIDSPLSILAENILKNENDSESEESEEIKLLSERIEKLEELLNAKLALERPGIDILLDEQVTDEEVNEFITKNIVEKNLSYGEKTNYIEHLTGDPRDGSHSTAQTADRSNETVYLYGSPDPSIPMSETPCSGCGAILHCQEPAIPGYIPSQKYLSIPKKELRNITCQRCFMLEEYNMALNVSMKPEDYLQVIAEIKNKRALVVLVIDVTDFPNSIYKDMTKLIGKARPIYIVGNKVDLLPKDSVGYLKRTEHMIMKYIDDLGFSSTNYIKHIQLISAKTGYGIEDLVTKLMKEWHRKGHVYVVGCTNVGKSTLFNALLSSDYCKDTARDFIHRATISNWPGTTLNTLKFPIINPASWRLKLRADRLLKVKSDELEEERLRRSQLKQRGGLENATLMGHIGQTFVGKEEKTLSELEYEGFTQAMFTVDDKGDGIKELQSNQDQAMTRQIKHKISKYDESIYSKSWWCHDSPGVVNPQQIINLLRQKELTVMLTKRLIQPRSFILKPGDTIFVSGLSRLDYLEGACAIYFTVLCSMNLPVHVVNSSEADDFYHSHIGTDTFKVPIGNSERLNSLPSLIGRQFNLTGISWEECIADVLLSSIGWVSITAGRGMKVSIRAYTPGGYGCQLRQPALLHRVVNLRGKRKKGTKKYRVRDPKL